MTSIFDLPDIYEVVMPRPHGTIETEVANIERLLARNGVTQARILELACGVCAHGIPLAQRGHTLTGLDRSDGMLAEARRRTAAAAVPVRLVASDVVDFQLDEAPFDCAIFMYETFQLITEYDELVRHFAAVRRHLKPGGLYVIDLAPCRHGVGVAEAEWGRQTLPLPNGSVELWHNDYPGDWVAGTSHLVFHCRIVQDGQVTETVDDWRIRVYSPWELTILVRTLDGWSLDGFYSWRDLSTEIASESHYWMVLRTL
jgi:SAM-dependent methyltransferase